MPVSKPHITRVGIPSNKFAIGRAAPISQISEHHVVGDAVHVINKANSKIIFSTTFTIGMDGTIYQLVDIANTPFCDNAWQSNARSITIEHAGGHANFPYTEAMYQSSIALHAWLFQTYGYLNCVRHRDIPEVKANASKATACPGGLDVERIVREAKQLLTQGADEMITPADIDILRIVHATAGWDFNRTHAGEYDQQFLSAWQGKSEKDFIRSQWNQAGNYMAQAADAYKRLPVLVSAIKEMEAKLTEANNKPAHEVIKEVEKIVEKCSDAIETKPTEIEPKEPSWFTKLLATLLNRKPKWHVKT